MTADAESGFTLTELLVSLAILGMMAALLQSGLVTGKRVWERVETRTSEGEQVAGAQMALREAIEAIYPQSNFSGSTPQMEFAGDARGFSYHGAALASLGPSSPWLYRIGLSQAGALTVYATDPLAIVPARSQTARPLIRDVASAEFAYYGRTGFDNRLRWRDRWVAQGTLPTAIRVRLRFRPSDRRFWPDLVAQPAATADTLCVFDINTGRCRGR